MTLIEPLPLPSRAQYPSVYALQYPMSGMIKVGHSGGVYERLRTHGVYRGEVNLVGLWPIACRSFGLASEVERFALSVLRPWRVFGERFRPEPEVVAVVEFWRRHPNWWRFVLADFERRTRASLAEIRKAASR